LVDSVTDVLIKLEKAIRNRFDHLGYMEGDDGSFATGHVPHVAPYAYLCRRYSGLDHAGILEAEAESSRTIPASYKELLSHMNGASMLGVSLNGAVGGSVDRSGDGIGQPISIWYQNGYRPDYIPEGHLGIGAINGEWFSQGHLYLASTGEVELYNAKCNLVGAKWRSLAEFLDVEILRRFELYDDNGVEAENNKKLPGDTDSWEGLAEEIEKRERFEASTLGRLIGFFKRS
jgi:hypothetical protein